MERVRSDNDERTQLVTLSSAHKAAYELVEKIAARRTRELLEESKTLEEKLIKKYLSFAVPSEEIRPLVQLSDRVNILFNDADGNSHYEDVQLSKGILYIKDPLYVSIDMFLAYEALNKRHEELYKRKNEMIDRIKEEIIRMGEKRIIEEVFPEAMPYLEFKDFCSDIQFIRETIKKEADYGNKKDDKACD